MGVTYMGFVTVHQYIIFFYYEIRVVEKTSIGKFIWGWRWKMSKLYLTYF